MSYGGQFGQETAQPPIEVEQSFERPGRSTTLGVSGTTGIASSSHSIPIADSSDRAISSAEIERIKILGNLEKTVESFRSKGISKTAAISSVL